MKKSTRGIFLSFKRKLWRISRGSSFKHTSWRHFQFTWKGKLKPYKWIKINTLCYLYVSLNKTRQPLLNNNLLFL